MSDSFQSLFGALPLIGVVHLDALPGAPGYQGEFEAVVEKAVREARIYAEGGLDGIIVENFGDAPFFPDQVPAETIAAMAVVCREVIRTVKVPVGVNVLRNDVDAGLAVAVAAGASFVRVNVHIGAVVADQGVIQGKAHLTLRKRAMMKAEQVLILADVGVKHAAPLAAMGLAVEARDVAARGGADAVIVSGSGTGVSVNTKELELVKQAAAAPVLIGSGTNPDNLEALAALADGFIVGSWFKEDGNVLNPVSEARVKEFVNLFEGIRAGV